MTKTFRILAFEFRYYLVFRVSDLGFDPCMAAAPQPPTLNSVPPGNPGTDRLRNASLLTLDGYPTSPANFAQGQRLSPRTLNTQNETIYIRAQSSFFRF
jgi:hypothetical protein